jgi:hypothetical protein
MTAVVTNIIIAVLTLALAVGLVILACFFGVAIYYGLQDVVAAIRESQNNTRTKDTP